MVATTEQRIHVVVSCRRPPPGRHRWDPERHASPERVSAAAKLYLPTVTDARARLTERRIEWSGTVNTTAGRGWDLGGHQPEGDVANAAMAALCYVLMSLHLQVPAQPEDVRLSMRRVGDTEPSKQESKTQR